MVAGEDIDLAAARESNLTGFGIRTISTSSLPPTVRAGFRSVGGASFDNHGMEESANQGNGIARGEATSNEVRSLLGEELEHGETCSARRPSQSVVTANEASSGRRCPHQISEAASCRLSAALRDLFAALRRISTRNRARAQFERVVWMTAVSS